MSTSCCGWTSWTALVCAPKNSCVCGNLIDALFTPEQKAQVRMGDADDFGSIVTFLCGEQASFVNGLQLHVDGGSYAGLL